MEPTNRDMESSIVHLLNDVLYFEDIYIENYQRVDFDVYSDNIIKNILHECKFRNIGDVFDYPDYLPQPSVVDGYDLAVNNDLFQRLAVSKKFNGAVFYTASRYRISCMFLIDRDHLDKFSKIVGRIMQQDPRANMFRGIDFKCNEGEYIEVSEPTGEEMKIADVTKKKVPAEKLVFDQQSTLVEVMTSIANFFKKDTKKLYKQMEIAYKRGIILFGDPGNGKSATIREVIRTVPDVTKIVINPSVGAVTKILSTLVTSLDGHPAIVIIEDIDSLITNRNRSEFLNILDGVDIKSGIFFIGTTNYPERIDPAFMNRSGRFDRSYKIENPSEEMRRIYFQSKDIARLLEGHPIFKDKTKEGTEKDIVELLVKYTNDLPMASLKEVLTSTKYNLAIGEVTSIEEAAESAYNAIAGSKNEHAVVHNDHKEKRRRMREIDEDF